MRFEKVTKNRILPGPADYDNCCNSSLHHPQSFSKQKRALSEVKIRAPGPASYEPKILNKKYPVTLAKVIRVLILVQKR